MPGIYQLSVDASPPRRPGARGARHRRVLLFGLPAAKDPLGPRGLRGGRHRPAGDARASRTQHPELVVIADVCLCEYTDHGHCGVRRRRRRGRRTTRRWSCWRRSPWSQAEAGADVVAPCDMMDGRVGGDPRGARRGRLRATSPIMAYSAKFASALLRAVPRGRRVRARSSATAARYQMDPANGREAMREIALDVAEGADIDHGEAGAGLPRRDPRVRASSSSCRSPRTTSAASTRW